jgi:hypothetical protein
MTHSGGHIEGDPALPYQLFRSDLDGNLIEPAVANFQTLDEVRAFKRRLDWRYVLLHKRKRIPLPR